MAQVQAQALALQLMVVPKAVGPRAVSSLVLVRLQAGQARGVLV